MVTELDMTALRLTKLSDDQNVYGADNGTVVVYSAGKAYRWCFTGGVWVELATESVVSDGE
jgi:hypothetical protein